MGLFYVKPFLRTCTGGHRTWQKKKLCLWLAYSPYRQSVSKSRNLNLVKAMAYRRRSPHCYSCIMCDDYERSVFAQAFVIPSLVYGVKGLMKDTCPPEHTQKLSEWCMSTSFEKKVPLAWLIPSLDYDVIGSIEQHPNGPGRCNPHLKLSPPATCNLWPGKAHQSNFIPFNCSALRQLIRWRSSAHLQDLQTHIAAGSW